MELPFFLLAGLVVGLSIGGVIGLIVGCLAGYNLGKKAKPVTGPRVVVEKGPLAGTTIALRDGLYLGGKEFQDTSLPDVVLRFDVSGKNKWSIMPLIRKVRVFVNMVSIEKPCVLSENDTIWVGETELQFHLA
jgi:nitrogen fixation protein